MGGREYVCFTLQMEGVTSLFLVLLHVCFDFVVFHYLCLSYHKCLKLINWMEDAHLPKRKKVNVVEKNLHYCFCPF